MRIIRLFFILLLTIMLSSCDPVSYSFDIEELQCTVSKIELVKFENDKPTIVMVDENTKLNIDLSSMLIIEVLNDEQVESFVNEINKITLHKTKKSVNSPFGYAVLVFIGNDEIIVLSRSYRDGKGYGMCAKFKTDGEYIEHIADLADGNSFNELLKKYFGVSNRDVS